MQALHHRLSALPLVKGKCLVRGVPFLMLGVRFYFGFPLLSKKSIHKIVS